MANSTISIGVRVQELDGGFKQLSLEADSLKKIMQGSMTEVEKMKKSFMDFGKSSLAFDAIKNSINEVTQVMSDLQNAYKVQEEAETKLETVMRQRMTATEAQIQSIKDLCSAQQELGVIGDEVQLAGAQQLATFLKSDQALRTLIPAMNNLVAQQKGLTATQSDAASIANLFGKAMMGQTAALKRVGITFTEAEANAVKFGTEEERAAALARIITNNVGEMNAALAKTSSGKIKQLENAMGDFKEKMGAVVSGAMPVMTAINQAVMMGTNIAKVNTSIRQAGTYIKHLGVQCIKTSSETNILTTSLHLTGKAAQGAAIVVKGAAILMKTALITTGIGAAIWAIGEGVAFLQQKFSGVKKEAEELTPAISRVARAQESVDEATAKATVQIEGHIKELKNWKGSKEEEREKVEELNNTYGKTMGTFSSISEWYKKLKQDSEDWVKQIGLEAEAEVLKDELVETKRARIKHNRSKPASPQPAKPGQFNIPQNFTSGLQKVWQGMDDFLASKENEVLDRLAKIKEESEKNSAKLKSGINSGNNEKSSKKAEEILPEGSVAAYEKQIAGLNKKISLAIDPQSIASMTQEIEQLKLKIWSLNTDVALKLHAKGWEKIQTEVAQWKGEITVDVKPDTTGIKDIDLGTSQWYKDFQTGEEKSKALTKNISNAAEAGRAAASAFSSMGEAFNSEELDIAGIIMGAIANIMAGYASATTQAGGTLGPFGWAAFALSGLAQAMAVVAQIKNATAFASGGVVSGPTMALVGEYAGASNNPEVIAPLNKLRDLLPAPGAGVQRVVVTGKIRGTDIELVTSNLNSLRQASGKR